MVITPRAAERRKFMPYVKTTEIPGFLMLIAKAWYSQHDSHPTTPPKSPCVEVLLPKDGSDHKVEEFPRWGLQLSR